MPRLFTDSPADKLAARIIAAYLTRTDAATSGSKPQPAVTPQPAAGKALYAAAGCAACHEVPKDDKTDANQVSAVPSLASLARKWKPAGLADFLQNPLATRSHGRMPTFGFSASEAADVAAFLLEQGAPAKPADSASEIPTGEELAQTWRKLAGATAKLPESTHLFEQVALRSMVSRGCFDCHDRDTRGQMTITRSASGAARFSASVEPKTIRPAAVAPSLIALSPKRFENGCLASDDRRGQAPRFTLTAADRTALGSYLLTLHEASTASSMDRLRLDLATLNCLRCHNNEGTGGTSLETLLGGAEAALHSMPPMLTRVGERVNSDHLHKWLTEGAGDGALRPWVGARMPGFGLCKRRLVWPTN